MSARTSTLERTSPLEPLAFIAIVSLAASWGMQPVIHAALSDQGAIAQQSAAAALWISAVLSPVAALGKAVAAAAICWAIAIFIDEPLPLSRLVTAFCVAETVFALREVVACAVLMMRPLAHSASALNVPMGLNAFIPHAAGVAKLVVASWDVFHIAWGVVLFVLFRAEFGRGTRSAACLALMAVAARVLFSAVSLMYGG